MNMENSFLDYTGCTLSLGNFDGLHLGHKKVITSAVGEGLNVALMFRQHPQKFLSGKAPCEITTKSKEKKLLAEWGVQPEYIDFEAISDLSPEEFFYKIIIGHYSAAAVSCGFNYHFGKNAAGDAGLLRALCEKNGIAINISEPQLYCGEPISSTRIRQCIKTGDMPSAAAMLGRLFSYDFEVVHGDARGRLLGFPTINQFFGENHAVPAFGVYASLTEIDGRMFPSVTNIGIRPTVGSSVERSETHIIGFEGDLYGKCVEVSLIKKLRDEERFPSFEELSNQMAQDKKQALIAAEEIL